MTQKNEKKQSVTDRQTDGPTDGAGCRVACTRLKTSHRGEKEKLIEMCFDAKGEKSKTKFLLETIKEESYESRTTLL